MALGPFDLSGGPFLMLYAVLFVLACLASLRGAPALRAEGRLPVRLTTEEAAMLAGGVSRHSEALVAEMLAAGHLRIDAKDVLVLAADAPATPAVTALRALPAPLAWTTAHRALAALGTALQRVLMARGLVMTDAQQWRVRIAQALPFVALGLFGLIKLGVGEARDRPVGFLTLALIVTLVVAVIRFAAFDTRTRAGQVALAETRVRHARLRRAPTATEIGLGVALFGTVVLIGSGWEDLHRLRTTGGDAGIAGGDSGDGDGGTGDGGSGCGGGCGGCSS